MSANLLNNKIGVEQAQNLATVLKEHASLKSLCGNKGDETELDMSGKKMGIDGVIMLAPETVANGALMKFDISANNIKSEGASLVAQALRVRMVAVCTKRNNACRLFPGASFPGTTIGHHKPQSIQQCDRRWPGVP